jgi:hypothetical protein
MATFGPDTGDQVVVTDTGAVLVTSACWQVLRGVAGGVDGRTHPIQRLVLQAATKFGCAHGMHPVSCAARCVMARGCGCVQLRRRAAATVVMRAAMDAVAGDGSARFVLMLSEGVREGQRLALRYAEARRPAVLARLAVAVPSVALDVSAACRSDPAVVAVPVEDSDTWWTAVHRVVVTSLAGKYSAAVVSTLSRIVVAWIRA